MNSLAMYFLVIKNWFTAEEGQDLIEYALIAGLIALAAVAALIALGGSLQTLWTNLANAVNQAATTGP